MDRELIDPKSHRQLFIDDHAVFKTVGIERTLHQPEDCGAVIRPDKSLGQSGTQTSSVPQWNSDKNLWEWWYYAHQIDSSPSLLLYSTSEDGIHWGNPSLGLHEWRGSKKNDRCARFKSWRMLRFSAYFQTSKGTSFILRAKRTS